MESQIIRRQTAAALLSEREWASNSIADDLAAAVSSHPNDELSEADLLAIYDAMYGFKGNTVARYFQVLRAIITTPRLDAFIGSTVFEEFRRQLKQLFLAIGGDDFSHLPMRKVSSTPPTRESRDRTHDDRDRLIELIEQIGFQEDDKRGWIERIKNEGQSSELLAEIGAAYDGLAFPKGGSFSTGAEFIGFIRLWKIKAYLRGLRRRPRQ